MKNQIVDPVVTASKFEKEVSVFRMAEQIWRQKGVLPLRIEYPLVELAFAAHLMQPSPIAFAVRIDFTNFDLTPPSVRFINPFSGVELKSKDLHVNLIQIHSNRQPNGFVIRQPQPLIMGDPEETPFVCLRGFREYHEHPAHSGDSWFIYRITGEGSLGNIIDQLYNHSIPYARRYLIDQRVSINYMY